jgi:hypothetical protein
VAAEVAEIFSAVFEVRFSRTERVIRDTVGEDVENERLSLGDPEGVIVKHRELVGEAVLPIPVAEVRIRKNRDDDIISAD